MTSASGAWSLVVSPSERLVWRLQRAGWGLMLVTLVLALLGMFGDGPLSAAEREVPGGTARIPRVARLGTATPVVLRPRQAAEPITVVLGPRLLRDVTLARWVPAPASSAWSDAGLTLTFSALPDSLPVRLELVPRRLGVHRGAIAVNGGRVPVTMLALP
jgi:hypothetical protein